MKVIEVSDELYDKLNEHQKELGVHTLETYIKIIDHYYDKAFSLDIQKKKFEEKY